MSNRTLCQLSPLKIQKDALLNVKMTLNCKFMPIIILLYGFLDFFRDLGSGKTTLLSGLLFRWGLFVCLLTGRPCGTRLGPGVCGSCVF